MRIPALVVLAALTAPAPADIITYEFSGVVTIVEGPAPVALGTPFTFWYRLDSATPDTDPKPSVGFYVGAITDASVDLGGVFQYEAAPGNILLFNDLSGDAYSAQVQSPLGVATLLLLDPLGLALKSDLLPTNIELEDYAIRAFRFAVEGGPAPWAVECDISTLIIKFPDCFPDCNGDTLLNLADFGCFQNAFALGNPYADCNEDQQFNLADFGCYQTLFALGCP